MTESSAPRLRVPSPSTGERRGASFELWERGSRGLTRSSARGAALDEASSARFVERLVVERRARLSRADGELTVGLPVFDLDAVNAVAVFRWSVDPAAFFELWTPLPTRDVLGLESGHYGSNHTFQRLSAATQFEPGVGLPGSAWASRAPRLNLDLSRSDAFLRAAAARTEGLHVGLAFPIVRRGEVVQVATILAKRTAPPLRTAEVWTRGQRVASLRFDAPEGPIPDRPSNLGLANEALESQRVALSPEDGAGGGGVALPVVTPQEASALVLEL